MLSQQKTNPLLLHISDSHETQNIVTVVIHAVIVFFAKQTVPMLEPFLAMLNDPASLEVKDVLRGLEFILPSFHRTCIFQLCLMIQCIVI